MFEKQKQIGFYWDNTVVHGSYTTFFECRTKADFHFFGNTKKFIYMLDIAQRLIIVYTNTNKDRVQRQRECVRYVCYVAVSILLFYLFRSLWMDLFYFIVLYGSFGLLLLLDGHQHIKINARQITNNNINEKFAKRNDSKHSEIKIHTEFIW